MASNWKTLAAPLILVFSASAAAITVVSSHYSAGNLSGWDTVDITGTFNASVGEYVDGVASAAGSGTNKLIVKLQQKDAGGNWKTTYSKVFDPGTTTDFGWWAVKDYKSGDEELRFRVSRKSFTAGIDWGLSWDIVTP